MFDVQKIKEAYKGLVGFRQNLDPSASRLKDDLLTSSTSGIWFDTQHPLMNLAALQAVAPEFDLWQFEEWIAGTYSRMSVVSREGKHWISSVMTDEEPGVNAQDWLEFDGFTYWLEQQVLDGVVQVVNDWLGMKGMQGTVGNLLSRPILFPENVEAPSYDVNEGEVVGLQLFLPQSRGMVAEISRIAVQMEMAEAFSVYLWRSDQPNGPVRSVAVSVLNEEAGGVKWVPVDWILEPGPVWYITYSQDDIVGHSVNAIQDAQRGYTRFPSGRYLGVASIKGGIPAGRPEVASVGLSTNYGINVDVTVRCDYTAFLVAQKRAFADVVAKGVALKLLSEYLWNGSARTNRHVDGVDTTEVRYDKHGEAMGRPSGLEHEYKKAMKLVAFDKTGLDPVCLPCRSNGVEYGVT